jgi:polyphenol oxidase
VGGVIELSLPGGEVRFTEGSEPPPRPVVLGRQVHGARVAVDGEGEEADGQATARADVAVAVRVADCLPVALVAPEAVAAVHAGWRGLAAGVLEEGVRVLRSELGATAIRAAIGPGIGPCCYEVGDEVRAVFGTDGRTLDLKAVARERLAAAGVEAVHDVGRCTHCEPALHSFRRDGTAERQLGIVWRS